MIILAGRNRPIAGRILPTAAHDRGVRELGTTSDDASNAGLQDRHNLQA